MKRLHTFIFLAICLCGLASMGDTVTSITADALPGKAVDVLGTFPASRLRGDERKAWRGEILELAEPLLSKPTLVPPSSQLYLEFFRSGNRKGYETAYSSYRHDLTLLALGACVTGELRYVKKLDAALPGLLRMPSWVLPAHDVREQTYRGKQVRVDLVSSRFGWDLALMRQVFGEHLSPANREGLDWELERRLFTPFEEMVTGVRKPDWLLNRNNWSIVCLANMAGALLAAPGLEPARRQRLLLACVEHSRHYLDGLGEDGYCFEGVSYWGYGFGHYLSLTALMRTATGGKLDLLALPKARLGATFPERIQLTAALMPAFSDCPFGEKFPCFWGSIRDRLLGHASALASYASFRAKWGDLAQASLLLQIPAAKQSQLKDGSQALVSSSSFPRAGIFVWRPGTSKSQLSVALKGGSNHEFHNHDDVGSFVLAIGDVPMLVDPGAEWYTARSFGKHRYESKLNNSFGHSVPAIDGQLQTHGEGTDGIIEENRQESDGSVCVMELKNAYRHIPGIRSLKRSFRYGRQGKGHLELQDTAHFEQPRQFESALITFGQWERAGENRLVIRYGGASLLVEINTGGHAYEILDEEIQENIRWHERPRRIAIRLKERLAEPSVQLRFLPLN